MSVASGKHGGCIQKSSSSNLNMPFAHVRTVLRTLPGLSFRVTTYSVAAASHRTSESAQLIAIRIHVKRTAHNAHIGISVNVVDYKDCLIGRGQ